MQDNLPICLGGAQSMARRHWYRHLAAVNQRIVEAREAVENRKIAPSKDVGRSSASSVSLLRSREENALQQLKARRERILQWVRTYDLPACDNGGGVTPGRTEQP